MTIILPDLLHCLVFSYFTCLFIHVAGSVPGYFDCGHLF